MSIAPSPPRVPAAGPSSPTTDTETTDAFVLDLRRATRGEVLTGRTLRGLYSTDASLYQQFPRAVFVPLDEADVAAAVKVCVKHSVAVTPRGGATSLSGQTFGPGLILDFSKHMDKVLSVDAAAGTAVVQPGVVRDRLNAEVKEHGIHFSPDPATGSRATVGGMIGNNTCGTRSVVYGKTIDSVISVRCVLADGTIADMAPCDDETWQARARGEGVSEAEAKLYRGVRDIVLRNQEEIRTGYPEVLRRVSGYNLDEFVDGSGYTGDIGPRREHNQGKRTWNLANLLVGSEGTLGLITEATIHLEKLPKATALVIVHFDSLDASLRNVDAMLEHKPSTVELLDDIVIREAKVNPSTKAMCNFVDGEPAAVQLVEFFGDTPEEAKQKAEAFVQDMSARGIGYAHPIRTDAEGMADVWNTRKLGLGLISNNYGPLKGKDFIEDACVPTRHLADYIQKIQSLCKENGIERLALYAHASVGVVHVVPALDLHHEDQVETMERVAEQAFEWVMEYGGSWSGEHGDGQLRGQFLPKMFGPELYNAFREVKSLFDPTNLMNPGKVIDANPMTEGLRYQVPGYNQRIAEVKTLHHHRAQGGFALAVEQCNGVGACRKLGSGTMCPSYMATRDEKDTTRGRANALRLAMSGQLGPDPMAALAGDGVKDVLDLCLSCKACKSECPNAVDMSKLKADVLQMRHDRYGASLGYKLLGRMPDSAAIIAGPLAPLIQAPLKIPGVRWVMEKFTGIDRRRPLPAFASRTLASHLKDHKPRSEADAPRGPVVLFNDTYASYMEPEVGVSAVRLLEAAGFSVTLANAGCCQRPRLSKGLVREAKELGTQTLRNLDPFAREGLKIVCLEPSCASALVDDIPDLCDDGEEAEMGQRVAKQIRMIDVFLDEEGVELESAVGDTLLHGHCHQKAMFGTASTKKALGEGCTEVDSGCCGMAGSFGYEHMDVSEKVGEDRLFPAVREATAAGKTIVAPGLSCRHQMHDFLQVEAKHFVQAVRVKAPAASAAAGS